MSEFINNNEFRKQKLLKLVKSLHEGKDFDEVKAEFDKYFGRVTTEEIAQIEQALVKEGLPVEEIQRLCDVHASVFKGSIAEIHTKKKDDFSDVPGHPVNVFLEENKAIEALIDQEIIFTIKGYAKNQTSQLLTKLQDQILRLSQINRHYSRKEYLFFPFLEKYAITAPPKVMWGVDDEIRKDIKEVLTLIDNKDIEVSKLIDKINQTVGKIKDMIYKENNILIPLMVQTLNFYEWIKIDKSSKDYGYTLITPKAIWQTSQKEEEINIKKESNYKLVDGEVQFDAGSLSREEINSIFNTLPVDITFVDKNDKVKFFTQGKERIFERPLTIIGREVSNCHPQKSVHVVEEILNRFKSGKKEVEEFYIKSGKLYVHIRYYAVRNSKGEYLGTIEVTQDIKPLRRLKGEKRLLDL